MTNQQQQQQLGISLTPEEIMQTFCKSFFPFFDDISNLKQNQTKPLGKGFI